MEKIINALIDSSVQGVDTYTHNDSTWLIFTESKQWVIELTDSKTLWYNYNFFKSLFAYVSLDVVQNQHYITKWVEDNIINGTKKTLWISTEREKLVNITIQNGVKRTMSETIPDSFLIEDTIQNGVKHTESMVTNLLVNAALENGVRETNRVDVANKFFDEVINDTIENGVRHTDILESGRTDSVEDTIQNGVKKTNYKSLVTRDNIEDIIDGGVKETNSTLRRTLLGVDDIIQDGVKHTFGDKWHKHNFVEDIIQDGVRDTQSNPYENKSWIEGVIKKGVKETNPVDVMKFFNNKMEEVLQNGVKETKISPTHTEYGDWLDGDERLDEIIKNGIKETSHRQYLKTYDIKDTIQDGTEHDRWILDGCDDPVDVVLDNGVKETVAAGYTDPKTNLLYVKWGNEIEDVINNGVIEINPLPSQTGNKDWSEYSHGREDRTKPFNDYLNDTLENGVKKLKLDEKSDI